MIGSHFESQFSSVSSRTPSTRDDASRIPRREHSRLFENIHLSVIFTLYCYFSWSELYLAYNVCSYSSIQTYCHPGTLQLDAKGLTIPAQWWWRRNGSQWRLWWWRWGMIDSSTTDWSKSTRWRHPDFPLRCLTLGHASAAAKLNKTKKRN